MASHWQNFLANLGAWQGSFTSISPTGTVLKDTPSLLSLEAAEQNAEGAISMVRFRLQRFEGGDRSAPPSSDLCQEYRSLGRQVVFFDTGTFCKGSLQLAPGTVFGGEFGVVHGDRRHRLVLLYSEAGRADKLVPRGFDRPGVSAAHAGAGAGAVARHSRHHFRRLAPAGEPPGRLQR